MVSKFSFPFGMADLHFVKSKPIEQPDNAAALYSSDDKVRTVYTGNEADTYYLLDNTQWYGLAAFTFFVKNRTHYRDYFIHDVRIPACPAGVYNGEYRGFAEQLRSVTERGKTKVIMAGIHALFEEELIKNVIVPLLSRSDSIEVLGSWQLQEKLFELGFKPVTNAYRWGESHA